MIVSCSKYNFKFIDKFTPFNVVLDGSELYWLIVLLDTCATSAGVWLLHQLEEMMERVGTFNE